MKKLLLLHLLLLVSMLVFSQNDTTFKGYLYNKEYQVFIQMNFYQNNVIVPGQEIFGELPGFFGAKRDSRKWLFTKSTIKNNKTAEIEITNDYGSEDLVASLTLNSDSTYTLVQKEGSNIKIAVNRKWVKIPQKITFIKQ